MSDKQFRCQSQDHPQTCGCHDGLDSPPPSASELPSGEGRLSLNDPIVTAAAKEIADSMRENKGMSIYAWELTACLILRRHFQAARDAWLPLADAGEAICNCTTRCARADELVDTAAAYLKLEKQLLTSQSALAAAERERDELRAFKAAMHSGHVSIVGLQQKLTAGGQRLDEVVGALEAWAKWVAGKYGAVDSLLEATIVECDEPRTRERMCDFCCCSPEVDGKRKHPWHYDDCPIAMTAAALAKEKTDES